MISITAATGGMVDRARMIETLATARGHVLADIVAKYDGRAPRYTSYPTALQFTSGVNEDVYRGWLRALPESQPVSLYLHVPFCSRLCWYCGCNTRAVNRHDPISEYVTLLCQEMALLGDALPGRMTVQTLHFGGGSPNMLSLEDVERLFAELDVAFALAPGREVAVELDATGLTRDWVRALRRRGLNRASLGVQNLDPAVQAAVNRIQPFEEIADGVRWLREAGVGSINLDLMYGLPHQTTANTLWTVDAILRLQPERIALFGYAHVPWMKAHQRLIDEGALPWPAARLEQAEAAAERLTAEGYVRIGLDHFARGDDQMAKALAAGALRRNFQGYTTDGTDTLLGLGASAIGRLPQGFVQNVARELGWRVAVQTGQLPIARGVAVTAEDRFRAEIIERLMCDLAVDLDAVCARHGRSVADLAAAVTRLAPFLGDGLARLEGRRLEIVGSGRLVVRSVCAAFDAYFEPAAERHSKAL